MITEGKEANIHKSLNIYMTESKHYHRLVFIPKASQFGSVYTKILLGLPEY